MSFPKLCKHIYLLTLIIMVCSCSNHPLPKDELGKHEVSQTHVENLTDSIIKVKQISTDSKMKWIVCVELKNHGSEPLFINSVITGCGCIKSDYSNKVFRKNETSKINITYTPRDNTDSTFFYKTIMIIFNEGKYYHAVDIYNK